MKETLTLVLGDAERSLLDDLVGRGLFDSREEAVKTAIVNLGIEHGLVDRARERRERSR